MRVQLADWLDRIVDHRRYHKRTALERYAEEKEHLVRLPRHAYDTARVVYRVCGIDGFVDWRGNRYAIPYEHVTDLLPVRITQHELFVYAADLRCIARHELAPRGAGAKLDPAGLHPPPQRKSPIDLDQIRVAFDNMGEHAAEFFTLMSRGPARAWSAQARQILLLRERYSTDQIELALGHAASFGALEHAAVERILAARALPRTLDEYVAEDTVERIEQTLGHARTAPRDLTEYDRLPITSASRRRTKETTEWPGEAVTAESNETSAAETARPSEAPPAAEAETAGAVTTIASCSTACDDTSSSSG